MIQKKRAAVREWRAARWRPAPVLLFVQRETFHGDPMHKWSIADAGLGVLRALLRGLGFGEQAFEDAAATVDLVARL